MIYEYGVIATYLSLTLILLISNRFLRINQNVNNISLSRKKKARRNRNKTYDFSINVIIFVCSILYISRFLIFVFAPPEILKLNYLPNKFLYFLLVSFFFLMLWSFPIFLLSLRKQIRQNEQIGYLRRTIKLIIILVVLDMGITGMLYMDSFKSFFLPRSMNYLILFFNASQFTSAILGVLGILLLILSFLYVQFLLKRAFRLIRKYWFVLFILMIFITIFTLCIPLYQMGWYESTKQRFQIFSWQYGYLGWIALIFFATTIFTNISAMIILSLKQILINLQFTKHKMFFLVKLGFVSVWALALMVIFPVILILYY